MLKDLALAYVARFSTTGAKLEGYLARKIRERGVAEDEDGRVQELDVTGLVTRLIELGYVDDDAYARAKSRDLTARGYGARRVEQALWAAGVEEQLREDHTPGEAESRRAAILLAKKRRFGPFGVTPEDEGPEARHKRREKQVAAMLRAGHQYAHAGFIIDAASTRDVDEWLEEAEESDESGSYQGPDEGWDGL
ncbi:MAG: RecX family transcriptional regulator [Pseudomonadota bacterium]